MDSYIYIAFVLLFLSVGYQLFKIYLPKKVCPVIEARMDAKTVIVTGANTGIGKETALGLAKRGARVIMACRDLKRGGIALSDIVEKTGSTKVVLKQLDLASIKSIRDFAEDINKNEPHLHVLINNAGVALIPELTKTEDGFELTMAVNYLGHFLLTNLLLDLLKKSTSSRIVVVSSSGHYLATKEMKFDNINSERFYNKLDAYSQSKLAGVLFTRELAKRLKGTGVTVNSLHPGLIETEINRSFSALDQIMLEILLWTMGKTMEEGAATTMYLAVSEDVEGVSGLYFEDCKHVEPSKFAQDDEAATKLWEISADLVQLNTTV